MVVFNPRGNAIPQKTTHLFDYSKTVLDLKEVMGSLLARSPDTNFYFVGTSLGASIGVKYLAHHNHDRRIKGMVSIANPFNVYEAAANANSWKNIIYGRFLTEKLVEKVLFNRQVIEQWLTENGRQVDFDRLKKLNSTFEFDQEFTFRILDRVGDSREYYQTFSCHKDVGAVEEPVLFLHSRNDPISSVNLIPFDQIRSKDNFLMALTPRGGHVEFFVGRDKRRVG